MSRCSDAHPSHRVVSSQHPSHQPFVIKEGGSIRVTQEMLLQLQLPRRQPRRGGLPFVVIFKRCKRGLVVLPPGPIKQGFAVFLGDGLRLNQDIPLLWYDQRGSAAAVVPEDVDKYKSPSQNAEAEDFTPPELEKD